MVVCYRISLVDLIAGVQRTQDRKSSSLVELIVRSVRSPIRQSVIVIAAIAAVEMPKSLLHRFSLILYPPLDLSVSASTGNVGDRVLDTRRTPRSFLSLPPPRDVFKTSQSRAVGLTRRVRRAMMTSNSERVLSPLSFLRPLSLSATSPTKTERPRGDLWMEAARDDDDPK